MHRQINRSKYVDFLGLFHDEGKCNNILALLNPEDGGTTLLLNVGVYQSAWRNVSEDF
jgi:hypothetical protein